jgi:hypothetical protein
MGQRGMGITSRGNIWGSVMVRATQSMCAIAPGLLAPPLPGDAVQDMVALERAAIRTGALLPPHRASTSTWPMRGPWARYAPSAPKAFHEPCRLVAGGGVPDRRQGYLAARNAAGHVCNWSGWRAQRPARGTHPPDAPRGRQTGLGAGDWRIEGVEYLTKPHPAWRAVRGRFPLASTPAWRHREPVPGLLAHVWNGH